MPGRGGILFVTTLLFRKHRIVDNGPKANDPCRHGAKATGRSSSHHHKQLISSPVRVAGHGRAAVLPRPKCAVPPWWPIERVLTRRWSYMCVCQRCPSYCLYCPSNRCCAVCSHVLTPLLLSLSVLISIYLSYLSIHYFINFTFWWRPKKNKKNIQNHPPRVFITSRLAVPLTQKKLKKNFFVFFSTRS